MSMLTAKTRIFPLALVLAVGLGCQRQAQASGAMAPQTTGGAAPTAVLPNAPAPFSTPATVPGTPDIAALVAKVNPAVVNITTVHDIRGSRGQDFDFPFDPFGMFPFFGGKKPRGDQVFKQRALGTGFLIDSSGHVVTNAHVVEGADDVKVKLQDDREFQAKVKGRDSRLDLAVLELVGAKDLPYVSLGSSEEIRVGDYVVAIGNPFGLGHTVTHGIISAKSRTIGAGPYDDFLQTDASINPGNSGGPLFNMRGQVIGINTAINPNGQGIGFAIPVDAAKTVIPQLLTTGHVARGRLGVSIQRVDAPLAAALGLDRPRGALVGQVEAGSPAERAGLKAGDVILKVDQTPVLHNDELPRIVASHAPGSKVRVEVLRDKVTRSFDVTLDALKDEEEGQGSQSGAPGPRAPASLGIGLSDVPGQGVVVRQIAPNSPAEGALAPGDVIVEVNHQAVQNAAQVARLLAGGGRTILFKIVREGQPRFVAVERR
jgi:serine protease Do